MQVELEVRIAPNGSALTIAEVLARLPGLAMTVAPALERAAPAFVGRIRVDGDDAEVRRAVAGHLLALRAFSTELPAATVVVVADDGAGLRLEAGSFGADEDELAALLAEVVDDEPWRVLVSFRVDASAHAHVRDLVARAVPRGLTPVVDEQPAALAIGFALHGDRDQVARLVGCLRLAWRQEGGDIECLLEIEGPAPVLTVLRTWADWVAIERAIRQPPAAPARDPAAAAELAGEVTALAELPEVGLVLGARRLSWVDADDQILSLEGGRLYARPDRVEAGWVVQVRRRGDGALVIVDGERRVALTPAADDVERRLHGVVLGRALLSESRGEGGAARTRLYLAGVDGVREGPELPCVRALALAGEQVLALAGAPERPSLRLFQLAEGWGHAEARPWRDDEDATDLAVLSDTRVAITVQRASRAVLYLVERANHSYARTIALPCVAPQIIGRGAHTLWIVGRSPPPGPARCDLFRVDPATGKVVVETAELDSPVEDVVVDEVGTEAVLVTRRGVYLTGAGALRELAERHPLDEVTGLAFQGCPAVFLRGPSGARLILGPDRLVVPLRAPGYAPRYL